MYALVNANALNHSAQSERSKVISDELPFRGISDRILYEGGERVLYTRETDIRNNHRMSVRVPDPWSLKIQ